MIDGVGPHLNPVDSIEFSMLEKNRIEIIGSRTRWSELLIYKNNFLFLQKRFLYKTFYKAATNVSILFNSLMYASLFCKI